MNDDDTKECKLNETKRNETYRERKTVDIEASEKKSLADIRFFLLTYTFTSHHTNIFGLGH